MHDDENTPLWDELIGMGVSEETLQVVSNINGYSKETMYDVLYAVFGERMFPSEDEEDEEDDV